MMVIYANFYSASVRTTRFRGGCKKFPPHDLVTISEAMFIRVKEVSTGANTLAQNCKFKIPHLGHYVEQVLTFFIHPNLMEATCGVKTCKIFSLW